MTARGPSGAGRPIVTGLVAAAAGAVVLGLGFATQPQRTFMAYLAAWVYFLTIALGALCLLMIGHAVGAKWIVVVRRLTEGVAGAVPVFAVLFVPLCFGLGELYPWVPPFDGLPQRLVEEIHAKQAYLNVPFFLARSFAYLAIFSLLAVLLRRWSFRQDEDPAAAPPARAVAISGPGLMVFGFTLTFAAIDWLMSLSPGFMSKVFGLYVFAGGMVGGLAVMLVVVHRLRRRGVLSAEIGASHVHALGRLLLTFTVFWVYMAYSQGFLVWIADLPSEAEWYLARWEGGWAVVTWGLGLGHFLLPFLVLLWRPVKRSSRAMAWVAAWMLLMHAVDVFWLVLPALYASGSAAHGVGTLWLAGAWIDLGALLFVGGAAVAFAAWRLAGHPLVPRHDPRLATSLGYESP